MYGERDESGRLWAAEGGKERAWDALRPRVDRPDELRVRAGQELLEEGLDLCPGQKPPHLDVEPPARLSKSAIQDRFTGEDAIAT